MRPRACALALSLALGTSTLLGACGTSRPPDAPAGIAWSAMNQEQKVAYMRSTVLPRMRALFVEFDPHKYPKMDCVPCHSADRAAGWKMPNPDLALDPSCLSGTADSIYGSEQAAAATARMNAFMRARVQPAMAALVGRTAFDCFGCHVAERPSVAIPTVPPVSTDDSPERRECWRRCRETQMQHPTEPPTNCETVCPAKPR